MWHIDTTVIRLLDGTRAYLHAVIDNFSRRILAWRVAAPIVDGLPRAAWTSWDPPGRGSFVSRARLTPSPMRPHTPSAANSEAPKGNLPLLATRWSLTKTRAWLSFG